MRLGQEGRLGVGSRSGRAGGEGGSRAGEGHRLVRFRCEARCWRGSFTASTSLQSALIRYVPGGACRAVDACIVPMYIRYIVDPGLVVHRQFVAGISVGTRKFCAICCRPREPSTSVRALRTSNALCHRHHYRPCPLRLDRTPRVPGLVINVGCTIVLGIGILWFCPACTAPYVLYRV